MYERAKTAVTRLGEIENQAGESPKPSDTPIMQLGGAGLQAILSVRNLNFTYPKLTNLNDPSRFSLNGISFDLPPRARLGIAGPVGSGKTTLLQLLVRLYDPPQGTIFLRGRDTLTLDPFELRRTCGMASQTVHLFSDTVENNLRFGIDRPVSQDDIRRAASDAMILDEIERLPQGFQTEIGEKGIRLSGGQKQRLALARLFLRNFDVMILDDVLSAVDQLTEVHLIKTLEKKGCAIIVASHRPSVLKACDQIIVLESGRIKAAGTWNEIGHLTGAEESPESGS